MPAQSPSLQEFMYANTQAASDAAIRAMTGLVGLASLGSPDEALDDFTLRSGSAFVAGVKGTQDAMQALSASRDAETPLAQFYFGADTACRQRLARHPPIGKRSGGIHQRSSEDTRHKTAGWVCTREDAIVASHRNLRRKSPRCCSHRDRSIQEDICVTS
ncbi:hypothetical protein [Variovorax sp. YR566]|uniref:hypothetical protein n=1 Tax=Variovorax sp. YR566 TaxID=3450237 RepID=UPI003F7F344C